MHLYYTIHRFSAQWANSRGAPSGAAPLGLPPPRCHTVSRERRPKGIPPESIRFRRDTGIEITGTWRCTGLLSLSAYIGSERMKPCKMLTASGRTRPSVFQAYEAPGKPGWAGRSPYCTAHGWSYSPERQRPAPRSPDCHRRNAPSTCWWV